MRAQKGASREYSPAASRCASSASVGCARSADDTCSIAIHQVSKAFWNHHPYGRRPSHMMYVQATWQDIVKVCCCTTYDVEEACAAAVELRQVEVP